MRTQTSRISIRCKPFLVLALSGLCLLSAFGCARVKVEVRQRPLRNEFVYKVADRDGIKFPIFVDGENKKYTIIPQAPDNRDDAGLTPRQKRLRTEKAGAGVFTWPAMRRVYPDSDEYPKELVRDIELLSIVDESSFSDENLINREQPIDFNKPWFKWSVSDQNLHRRSEAIKVTHWLWGLIESVRSRPVEFTHYRRIEEVEVFKKDKKAKKGPAVDTEKSATEKSATEKSDTEKSATESNVSREINWCLVPFRIVRKIYDHFTTPQLSRNRFYVGQKWGEEPSWDKLPLEGSSSPLTTMLFRIVTLGAFWDSGYTTDDEAWGLHNSATAWGWMGKGTYVLVQDRESMQFRVKGISFDPTETTAAVGAILRDAAEVGLAGSAIVKNSKGIPYREETGKEAAEIEKKLKAARKKLEAAKNWRAHALALKRELEENQARLDAMLKKDGTKDTDLSYIRSPGRDAK